MPTVDQDSSGVATAKSSDLLPELSKDRKLDLLRQMLLIRRFEEKSAQAFQQAKIKGFCHLYIGQEAVAVGTISVLEEQDAVITAYRDHGHGLAMGMCPDACMAELFGKAAGCSKGKGGSMHFFDKEKGFFGGHGIVAGQTPLGAGIAYAQKFRNTGGVTLCYLGDGAINQGSFHESLNLAALWKLPVIYVIENNEYAMGTSVARSSAGDPLTKRAVAYDMAALQANGMHLDEVRLKTAEAVHLARTESQPTLLEIQTYRYKGHSMSDPGKYRTKEELHAHMERDPIIHYRATLEDEGILTADEFDKMDEEARDIAQKSYDFADAAPEPAVEECYDDIWAPETQIPEIPFRHRLMD